MNEIKQLEELKNILKKTHTMWVHGKLPKNIDNVFNIEKDVGFGDLVNTFGRVLNRYKKGVITVK